MPVGTTFSYWLRDNPELDSRIGGFDSQNLDYIWFAYRDGWFILIEEKMFSGKQSDQQNDIHGVIRQLLQAANGTKVNSYRGRRAIEYRGYYLVQFEKTNPNDSQWIKINSEKYTKGELTFLLTYGKLISFKNLQAEDLIDFIDKINELGFKLGPGDLDPYFERKNDTHI